MADKKAIGKIRQRYGPKKGHIRSSLDACAAHFKQDLEEVQKLSQFSVTVKRDRNRLHGHLEKFHSIRRELTEASQGDVDEENKVGGEEEEFNLLVDEAELALVDLDSLSDSIAEELDRNQKWEFSKASPEESTELKQEEKELKKKEVALEEEKLKIEKEKLALETKKFEARDQRNSTAAKLPKLQITPFDGDILEWRTFWDSFKSAIDENPTLRSIDKMNYLISLLEDEAKSTIAGLSASDENYPVAVDLLKERYANEDLIKNAHYKELKRMSKMGTQLDSLKKGVNILEKHIRSLEAMGENVDNQLMVSLFQSKLP